MGKRRRIMTVQDTLQKLDTQEAAELMAELYGEAGAAGNTERYRQVV